MQIQSLDFFTKISPNNTDPYPPRQCRPPKLSSMPRAYHGLVALA